MKRLARGSLVAGIAGVTVLTVGVSAAHAATNPPFEPDPNAVGTLAFYDASGNQVLSGNTTDAPFAPYAVGSASPRAGDVTAALFICLPKNGQMTSQYTCKQLTGYNDYPVTDPGTPSVVANATTPVGTIASDDTTLAGAIATLPNTATDGYAGLYQLRLRTSASELGNLPTTTYDDADILVTGTTYSVVYGTVLPGTPLPEAPLAIGLPLAGAAVIGGTAAVRRRRRRQSAAA